MKVHLHSSSAEDTEAGDCLEAEASLDYMQNPVPKNRREGEKRKEGGILRGSNLSFKPESFLTQYIAYFLF